MSFEFRPDFKVPPSFKAIWPKLREAFRGLSLKPRGYRRMARRVAIALSGFIALAIALALLLGLLRK